MKKQLLSAAISLAFCIVLCCGCNTDTQPLEKQETATITSVTTPEIQLSGEEKPVEQDISTEDFKLNVSYSPIYDNVEFTESSFSGEPQTYEELLDYLSIYDTVNLVQYEIVGQYTPEEAFDLTGEEYFLHSTTLYKAVITKDCLNDEQTNIEINISKAGTPNLQVENDPLYVVGQKYISPILELDKFLNSEQSWCTAFPELVFSIYEIDGVDFAYHIRFDVDFDENIEVELLPEEELIITSTINNPVKYTKKFVVQDLADFFKHDWQERGKRFFDLQSKDSGTKDFPQEYLDYFSQERMLILPSDSLAENELLVIINDQLEQPVMPPQDYVLAKIEHDYVNGVSYSNGLYCFKNDNSEPLQLYCGPIMCASMQNENIYLVVDDGNDKYSLYQTKLSASECELVCSMEIPNGDFCRILPYYGVFFYEDIMFFATENELYRLYIPTGTFELIYTDDDNLFENPLAWIKPLSNYTFYGGSNGGYIEYPLIIYTTKQNKVYYIDEKTAETNGSVDNFSKYLYELFKQIEN